MLVCFQVFWGLNFAGAAPSPEQRTCGTDNFVRMVSRVAPAVSGRGLLRQRKADTLQKMLKTRGAAQGGPGRIDVKVEQPVGVILVGFLQRLHRAFGFSQAYVDSGKKVR